MMHQAIHKPLPTIPSNDQKGMRSDSRPSPSGVDASQGHPAAATNAAWTGTAGHRFAATPVHAPNRTGLPDDLKSGVERLAGISLDDVRVHYNSAKPAQLDALAYTQGRDIHVAPRQERHLPHEAWHVVQQAQDRVKPTLHLDDGVNVNEDNELEREADSVAGQLTTRPALGSLPADASLHQPASIAPKSAVAQLRKITFRETQETIDTEDYTAEQLRNLIGERGEKEPEAAKALTAAIEGGEYRRDMIFEGSEAKMEGWAGSHKELAGSHHKFPKRTLGWLHSKMTPEQRQRLNLKLNLEERSGRKALARLRSNLIPWGPNQVASDTRSDDPEHRGEGLDIVRDTSGAMTPRSARYAQLADTYQGIKQRLDKEPRPDAKMTSEEANQVAEHLHMAELHHYAIEQNPRLPADYGTEFWQKRDGSRPWSKGRAKVE